MIAAVVVEYRSGSLERCLASLRAAGAGRIVVVDNGASLGAISDPTVQVLGAPSNLGYGAGANLGAAQLAGGLLAGPEVGGPGVLPGAGATAGAVELAGGSRPEAVLVCNPDVVLEEGCLEMLGGVLRSDPGCGIVGPLLRRADGERYPSARRFPSLGVAAGHVLAGVVAPANRWSRRYRMEDTDLGRRHAVDWVSGACMLVRWSTWQTLGGFDEGYFMYAEDVDLCWRASRAGWSVVYEPAAVATHQEGQSSRHHPYRRIYRHHRSAVRFAARSAAGARRVLVPLEAAGLALHGIAEASTLAMARRAGEVGRGPGSSRAE